MYLRTKMLPGLIVKLILASGVLLVTAGLASAHPGEEPPGTPLDFVTGGGWIQRPSGVHANFGVGGGVKNGAFWGHLNYIDHGNGLHVKGISVIGYLFIDTNTRDICGRAETNQLGEVDYHVRVTDNGEPGRDDVFIIRLGRSGVMLYTTEGDPDHTLGGPGPGGGNIQLHKGNRSNTAPATPPDCNI